MLSLQASGRSVLYASIVQHPQRNAAPRLDEFKSQQPSYFAGVQTLSMHGYRVALKYADVWSASRALLDNCPDTKFSTAVHVVS